MRIPERKVGTAMPIHESREMYLETIYILRRGGYITVDENGFITLTASGKATAEHIYERHTVLTEMLLGLGVDKETAANDACRMEHYISDKSFDAIKRHLTENGVILPALPHDATIDEPADTSTDSDSGTEHRTKVKTAKVKRAGKAK